MPINIAPKGETKPAPAAIIPKPATMPVITPKTLGLPNFIQSITIQVTDAEEALGYESVPSPLNFFSSHTYSFKSSPFTTTGTLFNYPINDEWVINAGAITGADNFDRDFGAWSQMSSLSWTHPQTGTTASFSILTGDVYLLQKSQLVYYSAILQQTLGDWHYVLQHDYGTQQNALSNGQTAH